MKRKVRPLFLLADLEAGGAQRVILTVLRLLDRREMDPHLGIIRNDGPLKKEIKGDMAVHELGVQKVRYALPGILRLCHRIRPDTVISTLAHLNLMLLTGRPFLPEKTRLIVREANTPSIRLRYTAHSGLYKVLYKRLYPLADRVICNSLYMKRDLENHFRIGPEKTEIIRNPVDVQHIEKRAMKGSKPYLPGKKNLLAVGRMNFQKGFDLLLKAFEYAYRHVSDLHLTLIGEGPEKDHLRILAADLGIHEGITFAGHRDNPFPFMAHADVLISSSRWEGLPNVVLESLACGTPVIAFDCPGGTGEIIKEGENGWLVPSADWKEMGKRIVETVRNEGILQQLKGRNLLPNEYHAPHVVKEFEDLLKRLVHKQGR